MNNNKDLRDHLVNLLQGEHAHVSFETAIKNFPFEKAGIKPDGFVHSAWQILEHIRIAQWDIVEFSVNPDHVSPDWPEEHWPKNDVPGSETEWQECIDNVRKDLKSMIELVKDPATDLFVKIPHGTDQTILREALLVADHNAYHLGQLVMVRKALDIWPPE